MIYCILHSTYILYTICQTLSLSLYIYSYILYAICQTLWSLYIATYYIPHANLSLSLYIAMYL